MAAATNTKQKQQHPPPAGGQPVVVDPKFEWAEIEKAGGYVLRITLQGFKKGDFRVQVDGAGRLTVSGARRGTTPGSLHKVFQLPSTASLDDISGRFEACVLTLTVPKRAYSGVPVPTSIEEIKRDKPGVAKDDGATSTTVTPPVSKDVTGEEKKAPASKDVAGEEKKAPASKDVAGEEKKAPASKDVAGEEKKAPASKDVAGEEKKAPASKDVTGEEKKAACGDESMKPKTMSKEEIGKQEDVSKKAMDEATKKGQEQKQQEEASNHKEEQQKLAPEAEAKKEQEVKHEPPQATPEKPTPEQEVAMGEKAKSVVEQGSLASVVRRRNEEDKAKAMAAAMEAKAVLEKKATACSGWKERVAGGLEQLTDMKWADNVVEKARNNKEVVAIAIAAFSLGFFVSQKLFRK